MSLDDACPEFVGKCEEDMGAVVNNLENGGGKTKGVGDVIQGGGAGSNYFWVGYVVDDPLNRRGHWGGFNTG